MKTGRRDITVEENVRECEVCTGTIIGSDYRVMVDFRSAGFAASVVQVACEACAKDEAARVRECF